MQYAHLWCSGRSSAPDVFLVRFIPLKLNITLIPTLTLTVTLLTLLTLLNLPFDGYGVGW